MPVRICFPKKSGHRIGAALHSAFGGATSSTPIHPAKIYIFEAVQSTGQPLPAKELDRMSSAVDFNLVELSYHLRSLAKIGLLERTDKYPTRDAREDY